MELSKRLSALVNLAEPGHVAADVGCDHGYVSIYLAKTGRFEHVIAMDIRKGPLQTAEKNIVSYGMEDKVETRLSDGVNALQKGEADTLFCAGMGGALICQILKQNPDTIRGMKQLILQPQSEIAKVREYLRGKNWPVTAEDMVEEDGKYYPMMRVCPGKSSSSPCLPEQEVYDAYGYYLLTGRNQILYDFLKKEEKITQDILAHLKSTGKSADGQERIGRRQEEMCHKMQIIQAALAYY